jgi:hypothetical protein
MKVAGTLRRSRASSRGLTGRGITITLGESRGREWGWMVTPGRHDYKKIADCLVVES